jgi:hypothetical protein
MIILIANNITITATISIISKIGAIVIAAVSTNKDHATGFA